MSRRAILQIGTEKTGTTTLQHFLAMNRTELARNDFLYPSFCGAANHTGLAAFALAPGKRDPIREPFGASAAAGPAEVTAMRERLRRAANAELGGDATAIFCSEHCHSRLTTAAEVETLRTLLSEFFDDVQVSVYLRRQDQVALSLYSTRLKSGGADREILPQTNADDPYFNYDRSLALWEDGFGRANVHVRLFDRRTLVGGSVVSDFLSAWDLGPPARYASVPDQNESLQPLAQEFLRLANPHMRPIDGLGMEEVRGPFAARLARLFPGRGARPGRAEVEGWYARFRPSNEAVRRRHFPDRDTLFDEDFSGYPDTGDPREVGPEEVAAVAAQLHVVATRETRRLEAEIAIRDARLQLARDRPAEAELALRRALKWCPDHPAAHRAMAEHLLRCGRLDEAVAAALRAAELRPDAFEYWHFLGVLLRRGGDHARAEVAQRQALELNPAHDASRRELDQLAARRAAAAAASPPLQANGTAQCPRAPSA
jgi:hypothetical protein